MSNDVKPGAKPAAPGPAAVDTKADDQKPPGASTAKAPDASNVPAGAVPAGEIDVADVTADPTNRDDVRLVTSDVPADDPETDDEEEDPAISDGHCPLVIDEPSAASQKRVVQDVNGQKIVHREPNLELQVPTECPNCHKLFERHSLITNSYGEKDCAQAIMLKSKPELKAYFEAANEGNAEEAARLAKKHGKVGERLQRVFAPDLKADESE